MRFKFFFVLSCVLLFFLSFVILTACDPAGPQADDVLDDPILEDEGADDDDVINSLPVEKVYTARRTFDGSVWTWYELFIPLGDPDNFIESANAADGANNAWDICFTTRTEIVTNSGDSATFYSSGGLGGVVFSGSTDIAAVFTIAQAEGLFAAHTNDGKDFFYYDKLRTTSGAPPDPSTGNAMSFPGFAYNAAASADPPRDGLSAAKAWAWIIGASPSTTVCDVDFTLGTAYARYDKMTPNYRDFTNNVYIVRSGDGARYYKLQIADAEYFSDSATRLYTFSVKISKILQ